MIEIIIIVDLIGFSIFWYLWRTFEKKRNMDQLMAILFTSFSIVDIAWASFPNLAPNWMLYYIPSCWLIVFTRLFLLGMGVLDISRYRFSDRKIVGRRKQDKLNIYKSLVKICEEKIENMEV